jgi:two-component system, NarL family, sensor histidine kinase NreB
MVRVVQKTPLPAAASGPPQPERDFVARVVAARRAERQRLERALHDEVSQTLTCLMVGLETLDRIDDERVFRARIEALQGVARDTLAGLARLVASVRAPAGDHADVVEAVRTHADHLAGLYGTSVRVHATGTIPPDLDPALRADLVALLSDALTHTTLDALAAEIDVTLHFRPHGVRALLEHDGRAQPLSARAADPDATLLRRVLALGGRFHVEYDSTGGVQLAIDIPTDRGRTA